MAEGQRRDVLVVYGALMLAVLLAALDSTIVATALPTITADLGGLDQLSWVVTAYLLASTIATPVWGKLGDLLGRKRVFQSCIVVFLAGSALCGLAQGMGELIAFRALQGIGGGGLMVGAQAIIGDIVAPRDRGRYQGLFGAVFGVSSVAGPLIGGFLVDSLSWRWIFYVNLPVGVFALAVVAVVLRQPAERRRARIDVAGIALLGLGTACLVLLTSLGGNTYAWGSWQIVVLGAAAIVALAAFLRVERRAPEPVLPLGLFSDRTFSVASAVGFIVGFALFGASTYLPVFLQVVNGATPTTSGLQMLPLMAGLLVTSVGSGRIISRSGRYRAFPIVGTAVMTVGFFLLSRIDAGTPALERSLFMLVLGLGLGMVMQVLVLAVQNAVDYRDLGVATSGATFFRSIGGSIGTAVCGAVFSGSLHVPAGAPAGGQIRPEAVAALPPAVRAAFVNAYADALQTVFLVCAPIAAVAFALTWLLPELPLRHTVEAAGVGEAFAAPRRPDPLAEIERALTTLARRDSRRRILERLVARAGVDLTAPQCWVLARVGEAGPVDPEAIATRHTVEVARVVARATELRERGYVDGADGALALTPAGRDVLDRLVAARRERLSELLAGWDPEREVELAHLLSRLARDVVADHPQARG